MRGQHRFSAIFPQIFRALIFERLRPRQPEAEGSGFSAYFPPFFRVLSAILPRGGASEKPEIQPLICEQKIFCAAGIPGGATARRAPEKHSARRRVIRFKPALPAPENRNQCVFGHSNGENENFFAFKSTP
ncbi:UNVERIFIED_ORG: hypothetical protein LHK14_17940 [Roseateles sp. XES5]|nr:hypothetical protein [Roseateles sp. XES5]